MSPATVAEQAGVPPAYVDRLAEIGALVADPDGRFPVGSVQRVRIVQMLEEAGLPLDGLGEALRRGLVWLDFIDTTSNNRWGSLTDTKLKGISDLTLLNVAGSPAPATSSV